MGSVLLSLSCMWTSFWSRSLLASNDCNGVDCPTELCITTGTNYFWSSFHWTCLRALSASSGDCISANDESDCEHDVKVLDIYWEINLWSCISLAPFSFSLTVDPSILTSSTFSYILKALINSFCLGLDLFLFSGWIGFWSPNVSVLSKCFLIFCLISLLQGIAY